MWRTATRLVLLNQHPPCKKKYTVIVFLFYFFLSSLSLPPSHFHMQCYFYPLLGFFLRVSVPKFPFFLKSKKEKKTEMTFFKKWCESVYLFLILMLHLYFLILFFCFNFWRCCCCIHPYGTNWVLNTRSRLPRTSAVDSSGWYCTAVVDMWRTRNIREGHGGSFDRGTHAATRPLSSQKGVAEGGRLSVL